MYRSFSKNKILLAIKFILPLILLSLLVINVYKDASALEGFWQDFDFIYLVLSVPFFLLIYPEGAYCWYIVMIRLKAGLSLKKAISIWIISNTSRYLPGKIWQYVGRVGLSEIGGSVPKHKTIASIIIELFLNLTAALLLALFVPIFVQVNYLNNNLWIFFTPLVLLLFHPKITNICLKLLSKFSKKEFVKIQVSISFKDILSCLPWFVLNFLINGFVIYLLAKAFMPDIPIYHIIIYSSFYGLSWALGTASIFAPAGIGVADVSLAYLLSLVLPLSLSSLIAILYRVLLSISELIIFIIVVYLKNEK